MLLNKIKKTLFFKLKISNMFPKQKGRKETGFHAKTSSVLSEELRIC